jgi:fatty-acyl-CoA synthase
VGGDGESRHCVLKEGATLSAEELIDACKSNLAGYKKPTSVDFVGELPKNSTGKILKRVLRERYRKTEATN